MDETRILSPTAILGYGFRESSSDKGLSRNPYVIAVDAGSSDPVPTLLPWRRPFTGRTAVKSVSRAGVTRGIPVIIARWRAGASSHLNWAAEIVRDVARECGLSVLFATINSRIDKHVVEAALVPGRISSCGSSPKLRKRDLTESAHTVALLGVEPIILGLQAGVNVVLAGRAYNAAVFARFP